MHHIHKKNYNLIFSPFMKFQNMQFCTKETFSQKKKKKKEKSDFYLMKNTDQFWS